MPGRFLGVGRRLVRAVLARTNGAPETPAPAPERSYTTTEYWNLHTVTANRVFGSVEESLDQLAWRNDQYPGYLELMPVAGHDGRRVLDLGCGPGLDLLGLALRSPSATVVGADVSAGALRQARARLALHGATPPLVLVTDGARLPFRDGSFDIVHSSGVIHHAAEPEALLGEVRRVLAPGGHAQVMVYNRDSVWLHLYVAYTLQLLDPAHAGLSLDESFKRSTDGARCPVSRCWSPAQFTDLCARAGLRCAHRGNAASLHERDLLGRRFAAMQHPGLPRAHREFLRDVTVDAHGVPWWGGLVAGIDACYELRPA